MCLKKGCILRNLEFHFDILIKNLNFQKFKLVSNHSAVRKSPVLFPSKENEVMPHGNLRWSKFLSRMMINCRINIMKFQSYGTLETPMKNSLNKCIARSLNGTACARWLCNGLQTPQPEVLERESEAVARAHSSLLSYVSRLFIVEGRALVESAVGLAFTLLSWTLVWLVHNRTATAIRNKQHTSLTECAPHMRSRNRSPPA